MKLIQLDLPSFRSFRGLTLGLDAPRVLLAGLNGTGKSSIRDAIAWALTGHCAGTDAKGAGADVLIPTGASLAEVAVTLQGLGTVRRSYALHAGGAFSVEGYTGTSQIQQQALLTSLKTTPAFLDAVLDAGAFLDLAHADAKALVLSLLNVRIPIADQFYTLEELDLRHKQAFEERKLAKRAAQNFFLPPKPVVLAEQMPAIPVIETQLTRLRTALGEARQAIGTVLGQRQALEAELARLNGGAPAPWEDVTEQIFDLEERLTLMDADAQTVPVETPQVGDPNRLPFLRSRLEAIQRHLPKNGCVLDASVPCETADTLFRRAERTLSDDILTLKPKATPKGAHLPESPRTALQQELKALQQRQAQRVAQMEQVAHATARRQQIDESLAALPKTAEREQDILTLEERIRKGEQLLADARRYWDAHAAYAKAQTEQRRLTMEVDRLEALCDDFGPKGGRVAALAEAIGRFEAAIHPYVEPFGWRITFQVEPWQVSANDRPVETYSRSEQLRLGIALQLAIAQISGLGFACVDEVDMLDSGNRAILTKMLLAAPVAQILILSTRETAQALPVGSQVLAYRLGRQDQRSVIVERSAA
ncbi:MAG: AAA family ATPase [bacterium]